MQVSVWSEMEEGREGQGGTDTSGPTVTTTDVSNFTGYLFVQRLATS